MPPVVADRCLPAMQVWRKLPKEIRAEVIDGILYILGYPTTYHAKVCGQIFFELMLELRKSEAGEVFPGGVGVFLNDDDDVVIPDVVFVSKKNESLVRRDAVHGAADLHIEILSPSNRKHDRVTKKNLYEKAGVKEYWIIDPDTKDAWGYMLDGDRYDEPLLVNSKIHIRILDKVIDF